MASATTTAKNVLRFAKLCMFCCQSVSRTEFRFETTPNETRLLPSRHDDSLHLIKHCPGGHPLMFRKGGRCPSSSETESADVHDPPHASRCHGLRILCSPPQIPTILLDFLETRYKQLTDLSKFVAAVESVKPVLPFSSCVATSKAQFVLCKPLYHI
eukprot:713236-Rhodomonas_salina.1